MTTRLPGYGEYHSFGTMEENTLVFYDSSANTLIFQEEQRGTLVDRMSLVMSGTDPELRIPSNTTPTTDYLRLGAHDGTLVDIDAVGGTTLRLMIAGAVEAALTASDFDLQNNTLSNIGAAGNDIDATSFIISTAQGSNAFFSARANGNANARIEISSDHDNSSGTAADAQLDLLHNGTVLWQVAYDGSLDGLVISRGNALGTDDAIRCSNASPSVVTMDTTQGSDHDYICGGCGKGSLDPFECCGIVEWHDDVLALQNVTKGLEGFIDVQEGESWSVSPALQHMHDIGVLDISQNTDGTPWIGMNMVPAQWYTWSALRQMSTRVNQLEGQLAALVGG